MPDITMGTCYVQFAYDVAFSIDLAAAETRIREGRFGRFGDRPRIR